MTSAPGPAASVLAIDAGSPQVSVAVGRGGEVLAARSEAIARSSRRLLQMIDEALAEAKVEREELGGIAALRGPGSFTGLRVGLATALGLQLALGIPAAAVPSLLVLAASAGESLGEGPASAPGGVILAAVDALRGEWTVQPFAGDPPQAVAEAAILPAEDLASRGAAAIVGFGVAALAALPGWPAWQAPRLVPARPLAPIVIALLPRLSVEWEPALLTEPLYARPPAVTAPAAATVPRR